MKYYVLWYIMFNCTFIIFLLPFTFHAISHKNKIVQKMEDTIQSCQFWVSGVPLSLHLCVNTFSKYIDGCRDGSAKNRM